MSNLKQFLATLPALKRSEYDTVEHQNLPKFSEAACNQFSELSTQLTNSDAKVSAELGKLTVGINNLNTEIKQLTQKVDATKNKLESKKRNLEEKRADFTRKQADLDRISEDLKRKERELRKKKSEQSDWEDLWFLVVPIFHCNNLENEIRNIKENIRINESDRDRLKQAVSNLEGEMNAINWQTKQLDWQAKSFQTSIKEVNQSKDTMEGARKKLEVHKGAANPLKTYTGELAQKTDVLKTQTNVEIDIDSLKAILNKLKVTLQGSKENTELKRMLNEGLVNELVTLIEGFK